MEALLQMRDNSRRVQASEDRGHRKMQVKSEETKRLLKLTFVACPCGTSSAQEQGPTASWVDPVFSSQSFKIMLQL